MISGEQNASDRVALTWAERTIWLASAIGANPTAYNAACIVNVEGYIEPRRLASAIRQAVSALVAVEVALDDGVLAWRPVAAGDVVSDEPEAASLEEGIARLGDISRRNPIRADAAPLIRVHVVKVRVDLVLIMVRHHHVLLDFYANAALVRNVGALYGGETLLPEAATRGEIVAAERAYIASDLYAEDMRYWRARMAGMGADALWSPLLQQSTGGRFDLVVSPEELGAFAANVRALGGTPFQALLLIVYAHLSGGRDDDIVFGVPFANRAAEHAQTLASMSRIVPFRVNVSTDTLISAALANVRLALKADLARARFPIWENAEHVFEGPVHGALPKVALNYMRASSLKFGGATGTITNVLYGERNAETYIRCIEEADGRLSISIDDAKDHQHAENLGRAMQAAIAHWRGVDDTTIGALLGG